MISWCLLIFVQVKYLLDLYQLEICLFHIEIDRPQILIILNLLSNFIIIEL